MRAEHLLITVSALLLSFFLYGLGIVLVVLHLHIWGLSAFVFGTLFLVLFYLASRRRYLLIQMGSVAIGERVIQKFAGDALQGLFPSQAIACEAIVHRKGKIEILATIPYLSEQRREQKLEEIETALSATFLKHCGWKGSFIFNVSFS
ncbi:MAG: hypothetical protein S4CHLAM2_11020 [Chlamydiales bacterium]|nr:hypothetical protein [Chlamydiales bacterium]